MNMEGGFLRYQCRMCSEEFDDVHVPDAALAMVALTGNHPCPWPESAGMWAGLISIHNHSDGSLGAADLIGVKEHS